MITRKEDFIMKENLKVLMLNGSPKANGNTAIALREMENVFKENGVEVETVVSGGPWLYRMWFLLRKRTMCF